MKKKRALNLVPPSKGHKPNGPHGRAAVRALGRTKTTGNFAKIEKAKGKGAAIAAYQNALKAHKAKRSKKKLPTQKPGTAYGLVGKMTKTMKDTKNPAWVAAGKKVLPKISPVSMGKMSQTTKMKKGKKCKHGLMSCKRCK